MAPSETGEYEDDRLLLLSNGGDRSWDGDDEDEDEPAYEFDYQGD